MPSRAMKALQANKKIAAPWASAIREVFATVDIALAIAHPALYESAEQTMVSLKNGADSSADCCEALCDWPSRGILRYI